MTSQIRLDAQAFCPANYADLAIWNEKKYREVVNCILLGIEWSFVRDNKTTTQNFVS